MVQQTVPVEAILPQPVRIIRPVGVKPVEVSILRQPVRELKHRRPNEVVPEPIAVTAFLNRSWECRDVAGVRLPSQRWRFE